MEHVARLESSLHWNSEATPWEPPEIITPRVPWKPLDFSAPAAAAAVAAAAAAAVPAMESTPQSDSSATNSPRGDCEIPDAGPGQMNSSEVGAPLEDDGCVSTREVSTSVKESAVVAEPHGEGHVDRAAAQDIERSEISGGDENEDDEVDEAESLDRFDYEDGSEGNLRLTAEEPGPGTDAPLITRGSSDEEESSNEDFDDDDEEEEEEEEEDLDAEAAFDLIAADQDGGKVKKKMSLAERKKAEAAAAAAAAARAPKLTPEEREERRLERIEAKREARAAAKRLIKVSKAMDRILIWVERRVSEVLLDKFGV